ncbi:MAG: type III-B CRISPR module RAMP protein Cmr1 [Thermus sp.]
MKGWKEAYTPKRKEGGEEVWERTYHLLTPLFGGGVEPKTKDPVTVVRATEVRGQLRFFWRAIRGWRAEGSLDKLRDLEAEIFGSTDRSSPLVVFLKTEKEGESKHVFVDQPGKSFPKAQPIGVPLTGKHIGVPLTGKHEVAHPYLAFPLQKNKQDPKNYPVQVGVVFRLTLRFPKELLEEVEAALWAWETFGGIGARTRRGFGAIAREGSSPPKEEEIRERLRRYSRPAGWPEGVPHLTPRSLVRVVPLSWREVAERYQKFRQDRTGQGGRPGKNRWPEPDALRRLLTRRAPQASLDKFPRGQFGLPIIFHFRDKTLPNSTLKGAEAERLASPLLFRPLAEKMVLVAVLEAPRVPKGGAVLEWEKQRVKVDVFLTPEEAKRIPKLAGKTDPIRAFVESL